MGKEIEIKRKVTLFLLGVAIGIFICSILYEAKIQTRYNNYDVNGDLKVNSKDFVDLKQYLMQH